MSTAPLGGRRLTSIEFLHLSRPNAPHPDLQPGDEVVVLFQLQDPVRATVCSHVDRAGWVEVEQRYTGRPLKFLALATCCVREERAKGDTQ